MNKAEKLKQKAYRKISNYVGGFWVEYHFNEKELQQYTDEQSRGEPLASVIIKPNCIKVHGGENEAFEIAMKELHKRYIIWALGEKPRIFRFEMYIESNQEDDFQGLEDTPYFKPHKGSNQEDKG